MTYLCHDITHWNTMKRIIALLLGGILLLPGCSKKSDLDKLNDRIDEIIVKKILGVTADYDLQKAIDTADPDTEIRVEADAVFDGPITLTKNVKLSGGWTEDFTRQDLSHKSIIDGKNATVCVYSKAENAILSGFEIRNGATGGICLRNQLTVEYCWIHHCFNSGQGGGIFCTEQSGDALLLANSVLEYNKADAHGGAVAIGGNGTWMAIVNCLFRGNASIAQYGYTGAIHGQAGVQAYLVNNTIVDNINWRDGSQATSTPWSTVMFRNGGTHIVMINNIVAGNWYFLPGVASDPEAHPDRYDMPIKPEYRLELQVQSVDLNVVAGDDPDWICQSNVLAGADSENFIGRAGNGEAQKKAQDACTFVPNSEWKSLFVNADNGDYRPAGKALSTGEASDMVKALLGAYDRDLAGNLRFTDGKINAGCYQGQ